MERALMAKPVITVQLDDIPARWLDQMAHESGISRSELVRRGLARLMSAYPTTTNHELNQDVAIYVQQRSM